MYFEGSFLNIYQTFEILFLSYVLNSITCIAILNQFFLTVSTISRIVKCVCRALAIDFESQWTSRRSRSRLRSRRSVSFRDYYSLEIICRAKSYRECEFSSSVSRRDVRRVVRNALSVACNPWQSWLDLLTIRFHVTGESPFRTFEIFSSATNAPQMQEAHDNRQVCAYFCFRLILLLTIIS